jgi:serine/threonine protein kinase
MPHPLEGRTVGNFVLTELIDQGGVGLVFTAQHQFLGERAAVKILHSETDLETSDMARRFFQEAKATRLVEHPNVVKIIDFGKDPADGMLYLVMELLVGESVAARLERGPIPESFVCEIGASVAGGLQAAHDKGIIHRDLKPGNIFLCTSGTVKLLDFGMAKVVKGNVQTAAGIVVGTPQYMAPEQVRGAQRISNLTDVYGLGAVLFRMLTNRLPFIATNIADLIRMHLSEPPPRPSRYADVSPEMESLVLQCLEKEPHRRPNSMREVASRLKTLMARQPVESSGPHDSAAAGLHMMPMADFSAESDRTVPGSIPEFLPSTPPPPSEKVEKVEKPQPQKRDPKPPAPANLGALTPTLSATTPMKTGRSWWFAGAGLALLAVAGAVGVLWLLRTPPQPAAFAGKLGKTPPPEKPEQSGKTPTVTPQKNPAPENGEEVLLQSDPVGARVFSGDDALGTTPLAVKIALPQELRFSLDGYQTVKKRVDKPGLLTVKLAKGSSSDK